MPFSPHAQIMPHPTTEPLQAQIAAHRKVLSLSMPRVMIKCLCSHESSSSVARKLRGWYVQDVPAHFLPKALQTCDTHTVPCFNHRRLLHSTQLSSQRLNLVGSNRKQPPEPDTFTAV
ncbi:hypothetical protein CERZMDRAFT_100349 [Cercospora zeae-maydis SCOH1-5]|uniref:Uncharacterized protein n=1 Tax=Cercospora zeae-maydis SCOH1-5 TaxID=717836 RepID=A0A6A6F7Z0_9PEZI|nr:hypothetical protein CERZMDRAFT_100349 [Cercospora zeae-maydis SCOH1-5]